MSVNLFEPDYYRSLYSDLTEAGLDTDEELLNHFQTKGLDEERESSPLVNLDFYGVNNPDLRQAGLTTHRQLFEHLLNFGVAEARMFSPLLNLNFYRETYDDLKDLTAEQAFEHLKQFGVEEKRKLSPLMDLKFYQDTYEDLANLSPKELLNHLVNFGIPEKRKFSENLDLNFYQDTYADLKQLNPKQLLDHLVSFGFREGRLPTPSFSFANLVNNFSGSKFLKDLGISLRPPKSPGTPTQSENDNNVGGGGQPNNPPTNSGGNTDDRDSVVENIPDDETVNGGIGDDNSNIDNDSNVGNLPTDTNDDVVDDGSTVGSPTDPDDDLGETPPVSGDDVDDDSSIGNLPTDTDDTDIDGSIGEDPISGGEGTNPDPIGMPPGGMPDLPIPPGGMPRPESSVPNLSKGAIASPGQDSPTSDSLIYQPTPPTDAVDLGNLTDTQTINDSVSLNQPLDSYRFTLDGVKEVNLSLDDLTGSAYVNLLDSQGVPINGVWGEIGTDTSAKTLLDAGTYYIQVNRGDVYSIQEDSTSTTKESAITPTNSNTTNYTLNLSATPKPIPADNAGNTIAAANNLGTLSGSQTVSDWVGYLDRGDYYSFTLDTDSEVSLNLNGLSAGAAVNLLNSNQDYIKGAWGDATTNASSVSLLKAGTYYLEVSGGYAGDTNYTLDLSATAKEIPTDQAGNTLEAAKNLGNLSGSQTATDWLGSIDSTDYYSFTLTEASEVNLSLDGLEGNAYATLMTGNEQYIASAWGDPTAGESATTLLAAGTYYVQVNGGYEKDTNYNLNLSATAKAIPTDNGGNTVQDATSLGSLSNVSTVNDWVGYLDQTDYYQVTVDTVSEINLNLSGLTKGASVYLLDSNEGYINGTWGDGSTVGSISSLVKPGTYYLQVSGGYNGDTNYSLNLGSSTPQALGSLTQQPQTVSDSLTQADPGDFYSFTLDSDSEINVSLAGLSAGASLNILNSNGDPITGVWGDPSTAASVRNLLTAGTYYVQVNGSGSSTDYDLSLSAAAKTIPADNAGETIDTANDLGVLAGQQDITDWIGYLDQNDYYKFTLNEADEISLTLEDLNADVYVNLLNGDEEYLTSTWGNATTPASIENFSLQPGIYYVQVNGGYVGDTNYNLSLLA